MKEIKRYMRNNNKHIVFFGKDIVFASNMIGRFVKMDGPLGFSFYFGSKYAGGNISRHDIRVKFCLNPEKMAVSKSYFMLLHGDYKSNAEGQIPAKDLERIRHFFKKYKVIFAGVWEEKIAERDVMNFFGKKITLSQLIQNSPFYTAYEDQLKAVNRINEFEKVVRMNNIFNLHD